ncbi:hypothetical protein ANK1_2918 [plant metagenome]|uniref:Uncharacterized protein n=1 Tax=plant metagenome TaxID=1297885 RepID=A0A484S7Q0_9ZZZZ
MSSTITRDAHADGRRAGEPLGASSLISKTPTGGATPAHRGAGQDRSNEGPGSPDGGLCRSSS